MYFDEDIDISLFKIADKQIISEINYEFYKKYKQIPDEFNWVSIFSFDTEETIKKKLHISQVKNQYLCGCCWALSVVTALSDAFVIRNLVSWSPNISYTYALSRYPQNKCSGGSSRILLEEIKRGDGIASDFCVDESWCANNPNCYSCDSSQHFTVKNKDALNKLIPDPGCYNGDKKHYLYTVDDVYSLSINNFLKISQAQDIIKKHIIVRGPVVGGFLVLDNFANGKFTQEESGIYFEDLYKENFDIDTENILGSHSVVILGWGVSKNIKYKNIFTDIPYWFCRNSWGTNWGDNGYFKIAMYPFNKFCQFTKQIKVVHSGIIKDVGGVTGFLVNTPPKLRHIKSNKIKPIKFLKSMDYYIMDENLVVGGPDIKIVQKEQKTQTNNNYLIIYLSGCIFLFYTLFLQAKKVHKIHK